MLKKLKNIKNIKNIPNICSILIIGFIIIFFCFFITIDLSYKEDFNNELKQFKHVAKVHPQFQQYNISGDWSATFKIKYSNHITDNSLRQFHVYYYHKEAGVGYQKNDIITKFQWYHGLHLGHIYTAKLSSESKNYIVNRIDWKFQTPGTKPRHVGTWYRHNAPVACNNFNAWQNATKESGCSWWVPATHPSSCKMVQKKLCLDKCHGIACVPDLNPDKRCKKPIGATPWCQKITPSIASLSHPGSWFIEDPNLSENGQHWSNIETKEVSLTRHSRKADNNTKYSCSPNYKNWKGKTIPNGIIGCNSPLTGQGVGSPNNNPIHCPIGSFIYCFHH